jgi:nucleoside-diphosphate-sugar epimerase
LPESVLVLGCGYLGSRVAAALRHCGTAVTALTRSPGRAEQLRGLGIAPLVGDWNDRRSLATLPACAAVLVAVGYDRRSHRSRHSVYVEGLANALERIDPNVPLCYISTTGVYHQDADVWVDERSPCRPQREGARAHLAAEELLWRRRPRGRDVILRLAGLYGPGRVPRAAEIRSGQPLPVPPRGYLNLIHVDDAARAVLTAWGHPSPARCYVVADGHPVLRRQYDAEIARLTGASPPIYLKDETAAGSSRGGGSKRIWTARMRRDLLPQLLFPSYREGLAAILGNPRRRYPGRTGGAG